MSQRILITGGAGFLGSNLSRKLLSEGHQVHCIDNLSTGNLKNINELLDLKEYSFDNIDISSNFFLDGHFDQIYNLACPASPMQYQYDPVQTIKTSIIGSLHLLEHARRMDTKILQASTSEIYGDPLEHPQKESYFGNVNPVGIRACYDEGKRCAETLFFDFLRQYSLEIKVVRIFNTYGPRLAINDGRVVSNFIHQALKNKDITAHGDGEQTRSFCYVDDLVDGLICMMKSGEEINGPINLGNPTEITINELATFIIKLTDSKSKLIFRPLPKDDPVKRKPNIQKAKGLLNWEPKIGLEEGLKKTISYFKEIL